MNESEIAVLGAALLDPTTIDIAAGIIGPSDFEDRSLGQAFGMIIDMHAVGEAVDDTAVLVARLRGAKLLEAIGGVAGVGRWAVGCPNTRHAAEYARLIKAGSVRRRLKSLAAELTQRAADMATDPNVTIDWAEAQLTRHRSGVSQGVQSLADAMAEAIDDIRAIKDNKRVAGLPTGLMQLDGAIGGLYSGELIIVAARPSIGKSALGAQIGIHNAEQGRHVLFVSLEMSGKDIAMRQMAASLGYEVRVLRSGKVDAEDLSAMDAMRTDAESLGFNILSTRPATMAKIRAAAKIQMATTGLSLLVVDYLGLVQPQDRRKPRWESLTEISGELKSLALELSLPVLCLCQLNRDAEKGKPTLAHLRDTGAIEQDADLVLLLHRESRDASAATIDIGKARNGATGEIGVHFDCAATRFVDAFDAYESFT